jgi:hypothetical protein
MSTVRIIPAVLISAVLGLAPAAPAATLECSPIPVKDETQVPSIKDKNGKAVKRLTTSVDGDLASVCGPDWIDPQNYWRHGDFYALYEPSPFKHPSDAVKWATTRLQPRLTRVACVDGSVSGKKPYIGVYAYESSDTGVGDTPGRVRRQMKLHVLCVAPAFRRQGGWGTVLLNRAISDAATGMPDNQKVSIELLSHPSAEAFYNSLTLSCVPESDGAVKGNSYRASLLAGTEVERKKNWTLAGGSCAKVTYGCSDDLALYHQAVESFWVADAEEMACEEEAAKKNPTTKTFDQVVLESRGR